MKDYPAIPHATAAPDRIFESGHLWLLEKVDGEPFRFQVRSSGLLRFGDRNRWYDDPNAVPKPFQHAVSHVRANLERSALRDAVDDSESLVFFGEAMHRQRIDYDWDRMPSFLGFDVWNDDTDRFYPPDTVEQIYERLGLYPVNAFERERRARDFDLESYTVPQSHWYDGPAEGVIVRDKRGTRAKILHPTSDDLEDPVQEVATAAQLVERYATDERIAGVAATLEARDGAVTLEALHERVLEAIGREANHQLYRADGAVDMDAFRSALWDALRRWMDGQ
ncbi:RNA ligase family protein [Natrialbaceae archaeon A-chndr2]